MVTGRVRDPGDSDNDDSDSRSRSRSSTSSVLKWDLVAGSNGQEPFIAALNAWFGCHPGIYVIAIGGPPNLGHMQTADPSASVTRQTTALAEATALYEPLNARLYKYLLSRIDFTGRASFATYVNSKFGVTCNGYGLYKFILGQCDFSTGQKQRDIRVAFNCYKLSKELPSETELFDAFQAVYSLWSKLNGSDVDFPLECICKCIEIIPTNGALASFSGTIQALSTFHSDTPQFTDFELFVKTVIEQ